MRLFWIAIAIMAAGLGLLLWNDSTGSVAGLETDRFGRLLYLTVLGLVIGAGVLGSGIRLGQATRSIAVWLMILVVLVAGYQYRYELQDIASAVTAGLVPGSPLSVTTSDGANAVRLDRMAGGHFGVRGTVDGTPVSFMLDTGATATVLTAEDARRAGFDPADLRYDIQVSTANGMARAARVTAGEIAVGSIVRGPLPVLVAEEGRLTQSLLGMNFIDTLSGFDVRGERMILRD
ncbi:MAG: TIGR02281 family clan AA aspartic protease [Rhizobiaceae bacterium]|nr:TIGR02281 family clan AA aspartic protease [Rhizobiaceae bacterium]MCV0407074.1 TIGR02281 family clan AA aspartic protease [Rhizobiaceae bacterium]